MLKISWHQLPLLIPEMMVFTAKAGVTNPDISAIGQVVGQYTGDSSSAFPKKPTIGLGEVEFVLDAALNPYLNGAFVLSLGTESIEIEEAYASVIRGLPCHLAIKTGKYRLGFGKLNPAHPHAYPFISTPRVMDPERAMLLPGEESFNDVAVQVSTLIPVAGSYSLMVSGDLLQGDSFHPGMAGADFGGLGRLVNSFIIGDVAPSEIGFSITRGVNDPAKHTATVVAGADLKTKIAISPIVNSTVQAEFIYKNADHMDSLAGATTEKRTGFYAFTNFFIKGHYNAGVLYEQYESPYDAGKTDRGIKPFIGFAVLEESTLLRLAYEYFVPHAGNPNSMVELQFLYSMGPHKAHQF
jgi:hypothetical protein